MIIKLIPKTQEEKDFVGRDREISIRADDLSAYLACFSARGVDFEIDLRLTKREPEPEKETDNGQNKLKALTSLALLGSMIRGR